MRLAGGIPRRGEDTACDVAVVRLVAARVLGIAASVVRLL